MVKIAIIGEGPIASITLSKLLITHMNNKSLSKEKLEIDWYHKYSKFNRRHILNISKTLVEKLEKQILMCDRCINSEGDNRDIEISTRLLENLLLNSAKSKIATCTDDKSLNCSIIILQELFTEAKYHSYDHVFIAAGFKTDLRYKLIFGSKNETEYYDPIKALNSDKTVMVFYANLADKSSTNYDDDKKSSVDLIDQDILSKYNLELNDLTVFINTIYRLNLFIQQFDSTKKPLNLWVSGFKNFDEFETIFESSIAFLQEYLKEHIIEDIIKIFIDNQSSITDIDTRLFTSIRFNDIYHKNLWTYYKNFVFLLLKEKDGLTKNFMIHSVVSSMNSCGVLLDKKLIKFTNKIDNTYLWLLGDASNAYPPTFSLELGINFVNYIIPKFYKYYIRKQKTTLTIDVRNKLTKLKYNKCLNDINFVGGFMNKDNAKNSEFKNIDDIIQLLIENSNDSYYKTTCDSFMLYYNMALFISYITNISKIICLDKKIYGFRKNTKKYHIMKYKDKSSSLNSSSKNSRSSLSKT